MTVREVAIRTLHGDFVVQLVLDAPGMGLAAIQKPRVFSSPEDAIRYVSDVLRQISNKKKPESDPQDTLLDLKQA